MTAGFEVGKDCGTPHIQGCVIWNEKKSFKAAQELLGGPCATFPMKGTFEQNIIYCEKDENVLRHEDNRKQGARTDLDLARTAVKRGANSLEMLETHTMVVAKYPKFVNHCREVYDKERARDFRHVKVIVHWGDAGQGKSRPAFEAGAYAVANYRPEWWDGYDGEKIVLFDDFYGQFPWERLLRLLDGYPIQVPIKGAFRYLLAETIYITSNTHPDDWYPEMAGKAREGLNRRITEIIEFVNDVQLLPVKMEF